MTRFRAFVPLFARDAVIRTGYRVCLLG